MSESPNNVTPNPKTQNRCAKNPNILKSIYQEPYFISKLRRYEKERRGLLEMSGANPMQLLDSG